jgi:hypothetical protein
MSRVGRFLHLTALKHVTEHNVSSLISDRSSSIALAAIRFERKAEDKQQKLIELEANKKR